MENAAAAWAVPRESHDLQKDFFSFFHLSRDFVIDRDALNRAYHALQLSAHPDRHATSTASSQGEALKWATFINEAYQTLKDPLSRAAHLLKLSGVNTDDAVRGLLPEFLEAQMEWREQADEQATVAGIEKFLVRVRQEQEEVERSLAANFRQGATDQALMSFRQLQFFRRLQENLEGRIDALDI